ncbi:hypothetical protein DFH07DRAFT_950533 [Mycena maculata]|uniref:Uncharacterized protein n=1 Tax=Mycena maculata TaxID=230809 RepID=A0AAD7NXN9_9AGAR|nr:hypothetical protein DFH07DRAFT_950533 [Mycena maculata]
MTFLSDFLAEDRHPGSVMALGVFGRHFGVIRSRTVHAPVFKHAFSYIDTEDPPLRNYHAPYTSFVLPLYVARMFGRVVSVARAVTEDAAPAWVFGIKCPEGCDVAVASLYRAQEATLARIIAADDEALLGIVDRGFGAPTYACIEIWITDGGRPTWRGDRFWQFLEPGLNVEFAVSLERYQSDADGNGKIHKAYRARLERALQSLNVNDLAAVRATVSSCAWGSLVYSQLLLLDWVQLFITADTSRMAMYNVRQYMRCTVTEPLALEIEAVRGRAHNNAPITHALDPNPLNRIPPSVLWQVLRNLLLSDRVHFTRTSCSNRHRCAVMLQSCIVDLLASFGFEYGDVKLLQAATGTMISGSTVSAVVYKHFQPADLDFYCYTGIGADVVRYLEGVRGDLVVDEYTTNEYSDADGIAGVHWLQGPGGCLVNVIETHSTNPIHAILAFHSSGPRGAIEWDRVTHFEINRAAKGIALVTPTSLVLQEELPNQQRCWRILQKYIARGFHFTFQFEAPHECGRHLDCPAAKIRTTEDAGTLRTPLPRVGIAQFTPATREVVTWSLASATCKNGMVDGIRNARPATSFRDKLFRRTIRTLIGLKEQPVTCLRTAPYHVSDSSDDDYGETDDTGMM